MLSLRDVTLRYTDSGDGILAVHRITFDVSESDRLILLGPSGCGKSTLLKAIAGHIAPTHGEIKLDGHKVTTPGPDRVVVFQEFDQLLPWRTVLDNVGFPLRLQGMSTKQARQVALENLNRVGLSDFIAAYPHMLSGGMKQRVAIARALALQPRLLLMDEPFASLDALSRRRMQQDVLNLWHDSRFTLLFVTHSIEEAVTVGTRILLLSSHPGQLREEFIVPKTEDARVELAREIEQRLMQVDHS